MYNDRKFIEVQNEEQSRRKLEKNKTLLNQSKVINRAFTSDKQIKTKITRDKIFFKKNFKKILNPLKQSIISTQSFRNNKRMVPKDFTQSFTNSRTESGAYGSLKEPLFHKSFLQERGDKFKTLGKTSSFFHHQKEDVY